MIDSSPPNQQAFYEQVWSLVRQAPRGELLFLALATCYCNDIYREADIRTLMQHTDQVAEIQNSLRVVTPVRLSQIDVQTV